MHFANPSSPNISLWKNLVPGRLWGCLLDSGRRKKNNTRSFVLKTKVEVGEKIKRRKLTKITKFGRKDTN